MQKINDKISPPKHNGKDGEICILLLNDVFETVTKDVFETVLYKLNFTPKLTFAP